MAGDDEFDGPEYRPPPAQDDRLWRHPSEVAPRLRRSWAERHPLGVAAVAALSGALVTSAAWLFFTSPSPSTVRIKEQVAMPPVIALQPRYVSLDSWSNEVSNRSATSVFPIESRVGNVTATGVAIAIVENGYLIAPAHLVGAGAAVSLITDGARLPAEVVGIEPVNDIAVLHVDVKLPIAVTSRTICPDLAQHLVMIGASPTSHPVQSADVVAIDQRVAGAPAHQLFFRVGAVLDSTLDGAAILDDTGALVGIATVPPGATSKEAYAIPISVGRSIMWDLINSDSSATMAMGIDGVRVTGLSGSHDSGVRVSTVAADSPAARAGLRPDDVIVAMDGHAVSTLTAVLVFAHDRNDGHEVMIDLLRNGKATKVGLTR